MMIFTETTLKDAYLVEPEKYEDERGYFAITHPKKEEQQADIPETRELFLTVTDTDNQIHHQESEPLFVKIDNLFYAVFGSTVIRVYP